MKKAEGLIALLEILEACKDLLHVDAISVDSQTHDADETCTIKVKCTFNGDASHRIAPILEKHQLAYREEKGYLFLYS
jgi:hypothetical protein